MIEQNIAVDKTDSKKDYNHSTLFPQSTAGNAGLKDEGVHPWDAHLLNLVTDEMRMTAEHFLSQSIEEYCDWGKGYRGLSEAFIDGDGLDARVSVFYHNEPGFDHPAASAVELYIANEDGQILRAFSSAPSSFSEEGV